MAFLIRRYGVDGAKTESAVEGPVSIGRGTDNLVQLPGLLVAIHHLRVLRLDTDRVQLDCLTAAGVAVNGAPGVRAAYLKDGDRVQIGHHEIRILGDENGARLIEILEGDPRAAADDRQAMTSLSAAGWRMRRPAMVGAAVVLVIFLALPLLFRVIPLQGWFSDWLPGDHLWSSGTISNAHLSFGKDCKTCHTSLFSRVENKTCVSCHASVSTHGHDAAMRESGLDNARCTSCHLEHGDPHAVLPRHPAVCTDCHADTTRFSSLSGVGDVRDFGKHHPEFRMTTGVLVDDMPELGRKSWSTTLRDQSGLIFPHDLHLASEGIRGPKGREVLNCQSCHARDAEQPSFRPIAFEQHCRSCHVLELEGVRLPHGDEAAARAAMVSIPALTEKPIAAELQAETRRRPNVDENDIETTPPINRIDSEISRGTCAACHRIARKSDGSVSVIPPRLLSTWMPHARFTHEPHAAVDCKTCHGAERSGNSDDLLLAGIATCRACHGGVTSSEGIRSVCVDCHRFHDAELQSMHKFLGELEDEKRQGEGKQ